MTDPLFILGVFVAVLGIPGLWPWLLAAPGRALHFMAGCS